MIKKIPIISSADLSARNGVQKHCLQARAIDALHCNAFLAIIIIIIIIIIVHKVTPLIVSVVTYP